MDEKLLKKAAIIVRAKRQIESGGDYEAMSQEARKTGKIEDGYGAYQYMGPTWREHARKYLGDENADIRDRRNQDRAQFLHTYSLLKQGVSTPDIFAEHNGGPGAIGNWQNRKGVNDWGVSYDVSAYVQKGVQEAIRQAQIVAGRQIPNIPAGQTPTQTPTQTSQTIEQPEEEKMGLGKQILRGVGTPFVQAGLAVAAPLTGGKGIEIKKGLFKGVKDPVTAISDKAAEAAQLVREGKISKGKALAMTQGKVLETGLDFASLIPIGTTAKGAGTAVLKGVAPKVAQTGGGLLARTGRTLATNAGQGAAFGAGYGLAGGLQKEDSKPMGIVGSTLGGAAAGGALSYAIPAVTKRATRLVRGTGALLFPESVLGRQEQEIAKTNFVQGIKNFAKDKVSLNNKFNKITKQYGDDVITKLALERQIPKIRNGRIDANDVIDALDEKSFGMNNDVENVLNNFNDIQLKVDDVADFFKKEAAKLSDDRLSTAKYIKDIDTDFKNYKEIYGETITPMQIHEIKVKANKDTKAYRGDVYQQDKSDIIAEAARRKLEQVVDSPILRQIGAEQRQLIGARKVAQALNGQVANFGRMSQYMARMLGAIIGSGQEGRGFIGAILGALGGDYIVKLLQNLAISNPLRNKILKSIATDDTIRKIIDENVDAAQKKQLDRLVKKWAESNIGKAQLALPAPSGLPTKAGTDFVITPTGETVATKSAVVPSASAFPTTKATPSGVELPAQKVYSPLSSKSETIKNPTSAATGIIPNSIPEVPKSVQRVVRSFAQKGKTPAEVADYIRNSPVAADVRKDIAEYMQNGGENIQITDLFAQYVTPEKPKKKVELPKKKETTKKKITKQKPKEVIEFEQLDENDPQYDILKEKYKDILLKYYSQQVK